MQRHQLGVAAGRVFVSHRFVDAPAEEPRINAEAPERDTAELRRKILLHREAIFDPKKSQAHAKTYEILTSHEVGVSSGSVVSKSAAGAVPRGPRLSRRDRMEIGSDGDHEPFVQGGVAVEAHAGDDALLLPLKDHVARVHR